jgi:[ribosomal protein S5]-alanine N-acetyltransferase
MAELFRLRNFAATDAQSIALNANHFEIWKGVRDIFPFPYSLSDAEDFIAYANSTLTERIFAIDVEGKAVGAIGLHFKNDIYRYCGEVGYWIGPDFKGRGITTGAVGQIVSMAFEDYNLLRLYAEVFENNVASARVLEKNGFSLEAKFNSAIYKDNCVQNLLVFSKINPTWKLKNL